MDMAEALAGGVENLPVLVVDLVDPPPFGQRGGGDQFTERGSDLNRERSGGTVDRCVTVHDLSEAKNSFFWSIRECSVSIFR